MTLNIPITLKHIALVPPLLFLLWLGGFIWFIASSIMMSPQDLEKTTDAIVVPTGGDKRILTGLALFSSGLATHLFITGVHPNVSTRKIEALWEGEAALPPCCLTLGHEALTTAQNAQETREWLIKEGYRSLRLVTSNYHIQRALIEFKHAMPGVEIIAHPIKQPGLNASKRYFWTLFLSEYHKTLLRFVTLSLTPNTPLPQR